MAEADPYWEQRARALAARINLAWWLDRFLPVFVGISLVTTCVLLAARRGDVPQIWIWSGFAVAVGFAGFASYGMGRRHFFQTADARVRLECAMQMDNALTAAAEGVRAWPARREAFDGIQWRWSRIAVPPLAAMIFLVLGATLPVEPDAVARVPVQKPPVLEQMESWLETLQDEPAIEPRAIDELREQVDELAERKPEEWFSHSGLEAADDLQQKLEASLDNLETGLADAQRTLSALQAPAPPGPAEAQRELDAAMGRLDSGLLPLQSALAQQLRSIDPSKLGQAAQNQLQQLSRQLAQAQKSTSQCRGGAGKEPGEGRGDGESDGEGKGDSEGSTANRGTSRGPGTAPLTFGNDPTQLGTKGQEPVRATDLSRSEVGESIGSSLGAPEVDPKDGPSIQQGGPSASPGSGGEAVWTDRLTPEERRALDRFFR